MTPTTKIEMTTSQNDAGRKLNIFQNVVLGVKEGAAIQQTVEGSLVDGEIFTPIVDETDEE